MLFCAESVNFLDYKLDRFGIRPLKDKVRAIAPTSKLKRELQSFLGLLSQMIFDMS